MYKCRYECIGEWMFFFQDLCRPLVFVIVLCTIFPIKCSQTAWYCGYWVVLKCKDPIYADVVHLFIKMIRARAPKVPLLR